MADIEGLNRLFKRLDELALDTRRVERPLKAAGAVVITSVEKTFQAQGRPEKWTPLSPRTLQRRRKGSGKSRRGARILIDTARLKNSISMRLVEGPAVEVGTNVIYARRQHFGYDPAGRKGRGQTKTPARPFLVVQNEDVDKIGNIFRRHIARR